MVPPRVVVEDGMAGRRLARSLSRSAAAERLVNAIFIVIISELFHLSPQFEYVPDQPVVKKLPSYRPDQPLAGTTAEHDPLFRRDCIDAAIRQIPVYAVYVAPASRSLCALASAFSFSPCAYLLASRYAAS